MAVPFRRKSSKKSREGRSPKNLKFKRNAFPVLVNCENCSEAKVLHQLCRSCSTYRKITFK